MVGCGFKVNVLYVGFRFIFPVLLMEHQYILVVHALDQQHCLYPLFIVFNNLKYLLFYSTVNVFLKRLSLW